MKKLTFVILFSFIAISSYSQVNLVPNPGFETILGCNFLGGGGVSGVAPPWDAPSDGSPDLFNTCCTSASAQLPFLGGLGYQNAHAGNSCSGVGLYWANIPEFKEYLQVQLNDTLIAGRKYCASFYVNLFDSARYALSKIGMYFTETHTYIAATDYLNFTPQINNTTLITDTANWTLISGQYIANGGEQYIIIGNFFPDSLTDTVAVNPSQYFSEAYYFVDDVSVFEIANANAGSDTTICTNDTAHIGVTNYEGVGYEWQPTIGLSNATIGNPTATPTHTTTYILTQTTPCSITTDTVTVTVCLDVGLNQLGIINEELGIYPNPSSGEFSIATKYKVLSVKIKNILGEEIKIINSTAFDLTDVSKGIYFAEIKTDKGTVNRKIIKE